MRSICKALGFLIAGAWVPLAMSATITDLGTLGGSYSFATGINAAGQVVGYSAITGDSAYHAFLYSGGVMSDLGIGSGGASGINDAGQIVGSTSAGKAFLYSGGIMTDLGTLGGWFSGAAAINASGQIAGTADVIPGMPSANAFLYSGGTMTNLGTLGVPCCPSTPLS